MFDTIISLVPHLVPVLVIVVGVGLSWLVGKKWITEAFAGDLKEDISAAVTAVYHEYVKAKKLANEDGKLTEEEKEEARKLAIAKLIEIGKARGKDYAKDHLLPHILKWIELFVSKKKNGEE